MDCLFCKIAGKEIPSNIVYEDESAVGFLDIHPSSPGHTVVIPKSHIADFLSIHDDTAAGKIFDAVKKTAAILQLKLTPDGFTIGINNGKAAGQEIEHLHIHLIPRWADDSGLSVQGIVKNKKWSVEDIKKKIL